jgi:hypothetical protein
MTRGQTIQAFIVLVVYFVIFTAIIATLHLQTPWNSIGGFFAGMAVAKVYLLLANDVIKS